MRPLRQWRQHDQVDFTSHDYSQMGEQRNLTPADGSRRPGR
jgi:hypothetical protein